MQQPTILPAYLRKIKQRLNKEHTPAAAQAVIQEYFACFTLTDFQQELWTVVVGCLGSNELELLHKGRHRHDLIFFYEFTLLFMEAASLLKQTY